MGRSRNVYLHNVFLAHGGALAHLKLQLHNPLIQIYIEAVRLKGAFSRLTSTNHFKFSSPNIRFLTYLFSYTDVNWGACNFFWPNCFKISDNLPLDQNLRCSNQKSAELAPHVLRASKLSGCSLNLQLCSSATEIWMHPRQKKEKGANSLRIMNSYTELSPSCKKNWDIYGNGKDCRGTNVINTELCYFLAKLILFQHLYESLLA